MAKNENIQMKIIFHWSIIDFDEDKVYIMYSLISPKTGEKIYLAERHMV